MGMTTLRVVLFSGWPRWNGGQRSVEVRGQGTKGSGYMRIIHVNFEIAKLMINIWLESNIGIQVVKSET